MASISTDTNGRRRILFSTADGVRKQVRLGKASKKDAETICSRIAAIIKSNGLGTSIDADIVRWLTDIPDTLHKKLAAVGLAEPRQKIDKPTVEKIAPFIDRYIAIRTDVKPNTLRTWRQTRALLLEYFTVEAEGDTPAENKLGRQLDTITALDAKAFHAWMVSVTTPETPLRRFSPASVTKYTSLARQVFDAAVDARLIGSNPFAGIKLGKKTNRERQHFIDRETITRVLDGCKDLEFKLVIALSRYGGLRIPSELAGLQWPHIDRERGRILITSPKTERYEGGASREIPLFPELVPFIDEWFAACPEGHEHVLVSNRESESAWRTRMFKLLKRLGIPAWPRVFHNLRASRQTELEERFPSHVVCGWMGNSESVARAHYLQTTEDHFREGAIAIAKSEPIAETTDGTSEKAAQKAAQIVSEMEGNGGKPEIRIAKNPGNIAISGVRTGADGNRTHLAPLQTPRRV